MNRSFTPSTSRGFSIWPGMIFVLIGINVCIVGITVYFAHADRSFAVERDYYQKAIAWNQTAQQHQRNRVLRWGCTLSIESTADSTCRSVVVRVTTVDGQPLEQALVTASAFPSARSSQRQDVTWLEGSRGEYRSQLANVMPGVWEFRFTIRRGDDVFTASIEQIIDPVQETR